MVNLAINTKSFRFLGVSVVALAASCCCSLALAQVPAASMDAAAESKQAPNSSSRKTAQDQSLPNRAQTQSGLAQSNPSTAVPPNGSAVPGRVARPRAGTYMAPRVPNVRRPAMGRRRARRAAPPPLPRGARRRAPRTYGRMPLTIPQRRRIRRRQARLRQWRQSWIRNQAYGMALQSLMPLTPEQIKKYREKVRQRKKALHAGGAPPADSQSVRITLGPGGEPPTIYLAPRYASALTILDATGQPWPITSVTVGNGNAFQVTKPIKKGKGASVLTVVPMQMYAHSNIILTLKGVATPVVLRLETQPGRISGRTDIIVAARGPNAKAIVTERGVNSPDSPLMRNLLDGVPPDAASKVPIKGGPASAWFVDGSLYLRTSLNVLSPAWVASVSGASGVTVYEMPVTPTIVATDNDGVTVTLRLPSSALIDGALAQTSTTLSSIYGSNATTGSESNTSN